MRVLNPMIKSSHHWGRNRGDNDQSNEIKYEFTLINLIHCSYLIPCMINHPNDRLVKNANNRYMAT